MLEINQIIRQIFAQKKLMERCKETVCSQFGISQTEAEILLFFYINPAQNTATDVVAYRYIPKANVSKAIESLYTKGLLKRCAHPKDRRQICLILTDPALEIAAALKQAYQHFLDLLLEGIPPKEFRLYEKITEQMEKNIQNALR